VLPGPQPKHTVLAWQRCHHPRRITQKPSQSPPAPAPATTAHASSPGEAAAASKRRPCCGHGGSRCGHAGPRSWHAGPVAGEGWARCWHAWARCRVAWPGGWHAWPRSWEAGPCCWHTGQRVRTCRWHARKSVRARSWHAGACCREAWACLRHAGACCRQCCSRAGNPGWLLASRWACGAATAAWAGRQQLARACRAACVVVQHCSGKQSRGWKCE
jgi:hypothetical protein